MPLAVLNGPRYWLMDSVEKDGDVSELPKATFGGIEMYRQASVEVGVAGRGVDPLRRPTPSTARTVFTFDAGPTVYELDRSPTARPT